MHLVVRFGKDFEPLAVVLSGVFLVEKWVQKGLDVHQVELPEEVLDLVVVRVLFDRQLVYLHARLLVHLVAGYSAAHDLQSPTQLPYLPQNQMLFVFYQDVFVAGMRDVRVHIQFVVADSGLKKETQVAALIVLLEHLGIDLMLLL